jgi:orotidine-5'-phosphate decarboxylase
MSLDACDSGYLTVENDPVLHPQQISANVARGKLVVALDKPTVRHAQDLVDVLGDAVEIYKIGLELVMTEDGLKFARHLHENRKKRIFLDMKLLDIPNTVEKSVANVARMGFEFLTVHAHDKKTMEAAVRGRDSVDCSISGTRLKLLGVTVLTSYNDQDLIDQGLKESPLDLAVRRAKIASEVGFDGVIASGHEAKRICDAVKPDNPNFIIKVPGIRPAGVASIDQTRIMTPTQALELGATFLVIGRPITDAACPLRATREILDEISRVRIAR